jgi:tRNA (guanine37-N1)-methyltransferase
VRLDVFTLFPDAFAWFSQQVHVARARELGVELNLWDYRDTTPLRHGQVDDTPYGGGAGMVLRIDVVCAALEAVFAVDPVRVADGRRGGGGGAAGPPGGGPAHDPLATELAGADLCVLCGRYEGIDERVSQLVTDRVSIGPYVLSGGEIAAQVLLDAVVRKIDGAVSNPASVAGDSFSAGLGGALEYPQYTRPAEFRGWPVPAVLLSGDHGAVERWRRERLGGGEGSR